MLLLNLRIVLLISLGWMFFVNLKLVFDVSVWLMVSEFALLMKRVRCNLN